VAQQSSTRRYAIYYAPRPGSALHDFGRRWLGHDPDRGARISPLRPEGFSADEHARAVKDPKRYGFHGTLKPPFSLAPERSESELFAFAEKFARNHRRVVLPPFHLAVVKSFIALVPSRPTMLLDRLAADIVESFDVFRPPTTPEERRQRLAAAEDLTKRQRAYVLEWGYPYVLEEFRFHLTLSSDLPPEEQVRIFKLLGPLVEPLRDQPREVSELCLFVQKNSRARFTCAARFPLV
jgi:putative phosphonate metabolism protein